MIGWASLPFQGKRRYRFCQLDETEGVFHPFTDGKTTMRYVLSLGFATHAHVAQLVEHVLGKDEVTGSIPVMGSAAEQAPAKI